MDKFGEFLLEGLREFAAAKLALKTTSTSASVPQFDLLPYFGSLDTEIGRKLIEQHSRFSQKGPAQGRRYVQLLSNYLTSLKSSGMDDTKIAKTFADISNLNDSGLELFLQFIDDAQRDIMRDIDNTFQSLAKELRPIADGLQRLNKKFDEERAKRRARR